MITRLCEHFAASWDIILVTSDRSRGFTDWPVYRDRLRRIGVHYQPVELFRRDGEVFRSAVKTLSGILADFRPQVVHAHAGVPALAAGLARSPQAAPPLLVAQMYSWTPGRPAWMDTMDLAGFRLADLVVVSAQAYLERLRLGGIPGGRIRVVPWGLPLDELDLARAQAVPAEGRPTIGFTGRLEPRKNQLVLIEAVRRLRKEFPDARLVLLGPDGDPEYARRVRELAACSNGGEWIRVPGYVENPHALMAGWDLFVSASEDEGQGLAVQEAMYLGVPVVAAQAAGIEDFLRSGETGWLVQEPGPDPLSCAIRDRLRDPSGMEAVRRTARALIRQDYDWADTVADFEGIFSRLRPGSPRPSIARRTSAAFRPFDRLPKVGQ